MASTIPTARANLYALLRADADDGGSGVQVSFGPPGGDEAQELVCVAGVDSPTEEDATTGNVANREERYVLVLKVKVHDPAGEATDVDARGWAIVEWIRGLVLAGDRNLDGALPRGWAGIASSTTDGPLPAHGGGWVMFIDVRVACRARIS